MSFHWNATDSLIAIIILLPIVFLACCCFCCPVDSLATISGVTPSLPMLPVPNNVNVRVNHEILASLPTFIYSSTDCKNKVECPVCLMEFKEGDEGRFLPRCLHRFHAECIDLWFQSHSTCPLCRTDIEIRITDEPTV